LEQKYFIWHKKKKGKSKIGYRKNEEKVEFECYGSESLMFQRGTPIMLGPKNENLHIYKLSPFW